MSTTRTHKVENAARDWLERGLPGRSERTRTIYQDALAPLLDRIGMRRLRDLTAGEVESALRSLGSRISSRSVQIAHNSLRRSIRYAEADGKVGCNVAALVDSHQVTAARISESCGAICARSDGCGRVREHRSDR